MNSKLHLAITAAIALTSLHLAGPRTARAQEANDPHFHHIHINAVDPGASAAFYQKVFGAVPIQYNGVKDALFTERSFIFFNQVDARPDTNLKTTIWHIGWGGIDGANEYEWWKSQGMEFHTPATELGGNHYMYLLGADKEVVEIYTGQKHHRFNHVHLLSTDRDETKAWFVDNIGVTGSRRGSGFRVDNVGFILYPNDKTQRWYPPEAQELDELEATDGHSLDHVAFSFRNIEPIFERIKANGVEIVKPIAVDPAYQIKSFFVRGPDNLLVEVVEANPLPDAAWDIDEGDDDHEHGPEIEHN